MMMTSALAALSLFTLPHVFGAVTHTVMIGNFGSSYDPPTLSVSANDTVIFVFAEAIHGVTQSTFENPCLPLEGGFSSGLAGPTNTSGPYSWNLKVTDDTQPLWYFCGATVPVFHCTDGMVGAINPSSPAMYASFLSAAKSVSTMPVSTPTLALQGQGAFATGSPTPSSPPGVSLPPSSSAAPTAQPTSEPSKSNHDAAIIGGAVGGAIGIILIALLIFLVFYYRRRARKNKEKISAGVKPSAPPQDVYYTPGHIGASPSPPMTATSVDPLVSGFARQTSFASGINSPQNTEYSSIIRPRELPVDQHGRVLSHSDVASERDVTAYSTTSNQSTSGGHLRPQNLGPDDEHAIPPKSGSGLHSLVAIPQRRVTLEYEPAPPGYQTVENDRLGNMNIPPSES